MIFTPGVVGLLFLALVLWAWEPSVGLGPLTPQSVAGLYFSCNFNVVMGESKHSIYLL